MQHTKFWSRVGGWFRNGNGHRFSEDQTGVVHEVEAEAEEDLAESSNAGDAIVRSPATRLSRRELTLEKLEEGYNKVVDLIERVEDHLEQQDHRTERMARGIEELTASLAHLPENSRAQVEALTAMRDQMQVDLGQLPQIADAQRETMTAVSQAMDVSNRSAGKMAGSMEDMQQAMSALEESAGVSAETLRRMQLESDARDERMTGFLRGQTRLLAWFAGIAVSVALLAAALTVAALLK